MQELAEGGCTDLCNKCGERWGSAPPGCVMIRWEVWSGAFPGRPDGLHPSGTRTVAYRAGAGSTRWW